MCRGVAVNMKSFLKKLLKKVKFGSFKTPMGTPYKGFKVTLDDEPMFDPRDQVRTDAMDDISKKARKKSDSKLRKMFGLDKD